MGMTTPRSVLHLITTQVVQFTKYCEEGPAGTLVQRHYMKCLANSMNIVNIAMIAEVESQMKKQPASQNAGFTKGHSAE
jgi:hypothetical protein